MNFFGAKGGEGGRGREWNGWELYIAILFTTTDMPLAAARVVEVKNHVLSLVALRHCSTT